MVNTPKPIKKKESVLRSVLVAVFIAVAVRSFAVQAFHIPSGSMKNTLLVGDYIFVNELAYGFHTPRYLPFTNVPIPHFGFDYRNVKRGDVVVFEYPGDRDLVQPKERNVNYIKRCIALSGDTVEIRAKQVFVNGVSVSPTSDARLDHAPMPKGHPDDRIYPRGNPGWNEDWFGPLRIPKKGDVIAIDNSNIDSWSVFIQREGHTVDCKMDGSVLIDGAPAKSYTVGRDYLFMMGDNRDNSEDSRFWGFCPAENVVGSSMFVYFSFYNPPGNTGDGYDEEESQNFHIRWNRLLHSAQ